MAHVHMREEHPLPARVMHWAHLLCILTLTVTGFFIHDPFAAWSMTVVRNLHFWAMYILIAVLVIRIYWAIFGGGSSQHGSADKIRDGKFFVYEKQNRKQLIPTVKYYTFFKKTHPPTSKFNPLQKATYVAWAFLILLQALTGFAIYTPTAPYLAGLSYMIGGPTQMRVLHYLLMWVFIVTTLIHVYLAVAEDIGAFWLMFFGIATKPERAEAH